MSNPLSFFAAGSDDSDSDDSHPSDGEEGSSKTAQNDVQTKKQIDKKLPSPMVAIAAAKRPEFTIDSSQYDLDWDRLKKKAPVVPEKEFKPWENRLPSVDQSVKTAAGKKERTLAQQAPGASAPNKAEGPVEIRPQEYVDHSIQWSKMYQTMDEAGNVKRVKPQEIGGEEGFMFTDLAAQKVAYNHGGKRKNTDRPDQKSFRTKEAKKRNLGMANKDKMFVEDEKRVLRQQFDTNY